MEENLQQKASSSWTKHSSRFAADTSNKTHVHIDFLVDSALFQLDYSAEVAVVVFVVVLLMPQRQLQVLCVFQLIVVLLLLLLLLVLLISV